jgi:hypothetical protein
MSKLILYDFPLNPGALTRIFSYLLCQTTQLVCDANCHDSSVAVGAAIYSCGKKLMTDKTLRLYRNSPESREH